MKSFNKQLSFVVDVFIYLSISTGLLSQVNGLTPNDSVIIALLYTGLMIKLKTIHEKLTEKDK